MQSPAPPRLSYAYPPSQGFTLVEILVAFTIVAALLAIAVTAYNSYRDQQKVNTAVSDMRNLDIQIQGYKVSNDAYPAALSDIPMGSLTDPWGNPYQYLKIEGADIKGKGSMRKDKNLVPINSDFDLYSMGADGKSVAPLTSSQSKDDIVRANDGRYFGLASDY